MTKLTLPLIIAITATFGFASTAHADKKTTMQDKRFAAMDMNSDAAVSLKEYIAYQAKNGKTNTKSVTRSFNKIAGDDAVLTLSEFKSMRKGAAKTDSSKKKMPSKKTSAQQKEEWATKRFTSIDTNSDGMIDLQEYTVLRSKNKNLKERALKRQFEKAAGKDDQIDFDEFKASLKGKKGSKKKR